MPPARARPSVRSHGRRPDAPDRPDQSSYRAAKATPDLLVNNAGAAYFGLIESFTPEAVERQFAINVFGPLRVNRAFLPAMRARHQGLIVYVSSILGRLATPQSGVYAASKWAIEALAESTAYELAPQGIDVAIVQPGAFPTEIGGKRGAPDDASRAQAYGAPAQQTAERIFGALATAAAGRDPGDVARTIVRLTDLPQGQRPLRVTVPHDDLTEAVNAAAAQAQRELLRAFGLGDVLAEGAAIG